MIFSDMVELAFDLYPFLVEKVHQVLPVLYPEHIERFLLFAFFERLRAEIRYELLPLVEGLERDLQRVPRALQRLEARLQLLVLRGLAHLTGELDDIDAEDGREGSALALDLERRFLESGREVLAGDPVESLLQVDAPRSRDLCYAAVDRRALDLRLEGDFLGRAGECRYGCGRGEDCNSKHRQRGYHGRTHCCSLLAWRSRWRYL
jgi:hypothetical protein